MTATAVARSLRYQTGLRTSREPGSVVGCLVVVAATLLAFGQPADIVGCEPVTESISMGAVDWPLSTAPEANKRG
jgi:hypothetical protein